jgi:hypothetical protein
LLTSLHCSFILIRGIGKWEAENHFVWFKDFLPKATELGHRLFAIYEYNTDSINLSFGDELNDLIKARARDFLDQLRRRWEVSLFRKTRARVVYQNANDVQPSEWPIIIMAYGLGGLILKQVLVTSETGSPPERCLTNIR